VELMEQVALRMEKSGADAWYSLDPRELLGAEADDYEKVTDILDVWLDSGVSHYCVMDQRPYLKRAPGDKVIYLEGSDQHRGWFHSSLLTSVAMHGRAPYDEVLTHGFTVDSQGRKMSKSLGNGIEPQDVMKTYGADILRLWIAAGDYRNEVALSNEILKRLSDSYRRIRNTARFLLGNLHGFDPSEHLVAVQDSLPLDQWAVQQAYDVQDAVTAAYAKYDFPEIVQRIQNFCTNEMGALYLDMTKDRLYTMQVNSHGRRSAQSAMYRILEALVRWLAPMLAFTSEEIWQFMPKHTERGPRSESVLLETWYEQLEAAQGSPEQRAFWGDLLAIRNELAKALEQLRKAGEIGSSLDAEVDLFVPEEWLERYRTVSDELRFFFITSALNLHADNELPVDATLVTLEAASGRAQIHFRVRPSELRKCIRCWHHRPDVGVNPSHPDICARCVTNVEGPGEQRRFA
jgi:isoleucyl-tRNA synthetase